MKISLTTVPLSSLIDWAPSHSIIQEYLRRGIPITKELIKPEEALQYLVYVKKRIPELEPIITNSTSDIRSDYLKLLRLIKA